MPPLRTPDSNLSASPRKPLRHVNFLGIPVHSLTYDDMAAQVDGWLQDKAGRSHHIACQNAYCLTLASDDPRLARIYRAADIAGPDGMPFVYWIRSVHRRACDRFYAPDVVLELAARARTAGYTFYLYGATRDVLQGMEANLKARFPYLRIVGRHAPPFRPLTAEEDAQLCREVNALQPDILCVGLGTPKQDFWIDEHLHSMPGTVMLSAGATFDFFGGRVRMAPRWIQRSGFEWLYRLLGPDWRRLLPRYTVLQARFLWRFGLQLLGLRYRNAVREDRPG